MQIFLERSFLVGLSQRSLNYSEGSNKVNLLAVSEGNLPFYFKSSKKIFHIPELISDTFEKKFSQIWQ